MLRPPNPANCSWADNPAENGKLVRFSKLLNRQTSIEMRIQPHDILVPADDHFRHDLLDRKESIEVLTHLVRSFE